LKNVEFIEFQIIVCGIRFNSSVTPPDEVKKVSTPISFETEVDTSVKIPLSEIPLRIEISNDDEWFTFVTSYRL